MKNEFTGRIQLSLPPWSDPIVSDDMNTCMRYFDDFVFSSPSGILSLGDDGDGSPTFNLSNTDKIAHERHDLSCSKRGLSGEAESSIFLQGSQEAGDEKIDDKDAPPCSSRGSSLSKNNGKVEHETISWEYDSPTFPTANGLNSNDIKLTWSLKEVKNDFARWVESKLNFGSAAINSNNAMTIVQEEKVIEKEESQSDFKWLIEAHHGRTGMSFKLKLKGGTCMCLLENEIIDCVRVLVAENNDPSMKFLIKPLGGRATTVDSSRVLDSLIGIVPVRSGGTLLPFEVPEAELDNHDVDDPSLLDDLCSQTMPGLQSISSSSRSPSSASTSRVDDRPTRKGRSIRKRIGTLWRSRTGRSKRLACRPDIFGMESCPVL